MQTVFRNKLLTETVAIRDSLGRVLAQDIVPRINVPGEDNSAMDGWALASADISSGGEVQLREVGKALAGNPFHGKVDGGPAGNEHYREIRVRGFNPFQQLQPVVAAGFI